MRIAPDFSPGNASPMIESREAGRLKTNVGPRVSVVPTGPKRRGIGFPPLKRVGYFQPPLTGLAREQ